MSMPLVVKNHLLVSAISPPLAEKGEPATGVSFPVELAEYALICHLQLLGELETYTYATGELCAPVLSIKLVASWANANAHDATTKEASNFAFVFIISSFF